VLGFNGWVRWCVVSRAIVLFLCHQVPGAMQVVCGHHAERSKLRALTAATPLPRVPRSLSTLACCMRQAWKEQWFHYYTRELLGQAPRVLVRELPATATGGGGGLA
jgi:hypothetical protein